MGATQRMAAPKRSKVSDRVSVIVDDLEEEDDQASLDLWTWCEKFQLVVNSWALAGSFTVQYPEEGPSAATVPYVHWHDASEYRFAFVSKVSKLKIKYTEASILTRLSDCEEMFRPKAIELARGSERLPYGKVLTTVLQTEAAIWQNRGALILKLSRASEHRPVNERKTLSHAGRLKKSIKGRLGKQKVSTANKDRDGHRICKPHNDQRGCKKGGSCRDAHVCDILLSNGPCAKRHRRVDHDAATDGVPTVR